MRAEHGVEHRAEPRDTAARMTLGNGEAERTVLVESGRQFM